MTSAVVVVLVLAVLQVHIQVQMEAPQEQVRELLPQALLVVQEIQ
jgi:hypothetical protein